MRIEKEEVNVMVQGKKEFWVGENERDVSFLEIVGKPVPVASGLEGDYEGAVDLTEVMVKIIRDVFQAIVPETCTIVIDES